MLGRDRRRSQARRASASLVRLQHQIANVHADSGRSREACPREGGEREPITTDLADTEYGFTPSRERRSAFAARVATPMMAVRHGRGGTWGVSRARLERAADRPMAD